MELGARGGAWLGASAGRLRSRRARGSEAGWVAWLGARHVVGPQYWSLGPGTRGARRCGSASGNGPASVGRESPDAQTRDRTEAPNLGLENAGA